MNDCTPNDDGSFWGKKGKYGTDSGPPPHIKEFAAKGPNGETVTKQVDLSKSESNTSGTRPDDLPFYKKVITTAKLATDIFNTEFLVNGVLVKGQPCILAGPKKSLKTCMLIELALALARGGQFLGQFSVNNPVRVAMFSGESGPATIQETAKRIAWSYGSDLARLKGYQNILWGFDLPRLMNDSDVRGLHKFIRDEGIQVCIVDPTYLAMPLGDSANNQFSVGAFLAPLTDISNDTGCTIILCNHFKKSRSTYDIPELSDIAYSGFDQWARQWLLLSRRSPFNTEKRGYHELWFNYGGSSGHFGTWGLNINEGHIEDEGGRIWSVDVISAGQAYAESATANEEAKEQRKLAKEQQTTRKRMEAIESAIKSFPDGESMTAIRKKTGMNPDTFRPFWEELIESGHVIACKVKKTKGTFEGWKWNTETQEQF